MENQISIQIPAKVLAEASQKLEEVNNLLSPFLVALTPEERRRLPKMGEGNMPFVEKSVEYTKSHGALVPAFVDTKEMEIDLKAVYDMITLSRIAARLCNGLNDTMLLAGSEAYTAALSFYNSVKVAAKRNVKGAEPVHNDLKKRFVKHGSRTPENDAMSA